MSSGKYIFFTKLSKKLRSLNKLQNFSLLGKKSFLKKIVFVEQILFMEDLIMHIQELTTTYRL